MNDDKARDDWMPSNVSEVQLHISASQATELLDKIRKGKATASAPVIKELETFAGVPLASVSPNP